MINARIAENAGRTATSGRAHGASEAGIPNVAPARPGDAWDLGVTQGVARSSARRHRCFVIFAIVVAFVANVFSVAFVASVANVSVVFVADIGYDLRV